jgi:putative inorganic carbon (hco3(-)) transporter
MRKVAFTLYMVFIASWFLHLGSRIEALGTIRFDLLNIVTIVALLLLSDDDSADDIKAAAGGTDSRTRKLILAILIFSIVTVPFVEWPGSVLNYGLPEYVKALVFFFFTERLVTTERRVKTLLLVFVASMTFRVFEPVYLHVTTGYWGGVASMANSEMMDRLGGAPSDVINPNGLAFVILSVIPFFHYLGPLTIRGGIAYLVSLPILLWALTLTGSRSGIVGLGAIIVFIWIKSTHKWALAAIVVLSVAIVAPLLSDNLQDRYLSIYSSDTKNAQTAQGRWTGVGSDFKVALRRPLFGHGLGTSLETNANFAGEAARSHNLYAETAQELGFVGLLILIAMIGSIVSGLRASLARFKETKGASRFLLRLTDAVQVYLGTTILFSFASYGLSSYEWYFAAGLSEVMRRFAYRYSENSLPNQHSVSIERRAPALHGALAGVLDAGSIPTR